MRLPSKGGEALLYSADSLLPLEWRIAAGVPAISRALGTDLEDRMVYAVDDRGRLIGFDLLARQSRIYLATAERLSATADGTVLGVDSSRHPLRFHNRSLNVFRPTVEGFGDSLVLARGRSGRIAAYAPKRGLVQILAEDAELSEDAELLSD